MENNTKKKINLFKDKRGAEDSFQHLILTFVFVCLFSMILFTVIITQGNNYSKDSSEVLAGMNISGLNQTVYGFEPKTQLWRSSLGTNSSGILSLPIGIVTTALDSISYIASSMFTFLISPFDFISSLLANVFMIPDWIIKVFLAILIIVGIFGLIRLLKWGS